MLTIPRNEKGETIIEVLITIAILAVVLGLSYSTASKSLKASQTAQERTEAQYIAVSLIETIKILAQRDSTHVFPATTRDLCFRTTLADIQAQTPPINHDPTNLQYENFCKQGMYTKFVTITPLPPTPQNLQQYEYTATIQWDSLATGVNQSVMRYKFVRVPATP